MEIIMKTLQGGKFKTILKLSGGIEIKVDILNWVLFIPPRNYFYFSTPEQVLDDLLDYRIKQYAIEGGEKDMQNLKNAIEKARKEILEIMQPLMTIKKGA